MVRVSYTFNGVLPLVEVSPTSEASVSGMDRPPLQHKRAHVAVVEDVVPPTVQIDGSNGTSTSAADDHAVVAVSGRKKARKSQASQSQAQADRLAAVKPGVAKRIGSGEARKPQHEIPADAGLSIVPVNADDPSALLEGYDSFVPE